MILFDSVTSKTVYVTHVIRKGSVGLEFNFAICVATPVNAAVYSEFDSKATFRLTDFYLSTTDFETDF